MRVGSLYDQTVSVNNHPVSSRLYVTFPPSATWLRGGPYTVTCSTQLNNDEYRGNDRQTGSIYAQVWDVAVRALLTPQGQVDSGAVVVPACMVYNYGSVVVSYDLRLRIGTRYSEVRQVAGHQPLTARYLTFPAWTARERGNLPVSCSTAYDGDYNPADDRQTSHVFVRVNDVACEAILGIEPVVDSGTTVLPRVIARNLGNVPGTALEIVLQIDDGYYQRLTKQLPAGAKSTFVFPDWVPRLRGVCTVRCTLELTGDMVTANNNNRQVRSVTVTVHDIGMTAIVVPSETIAAGAVNPKVTVHNYGTLREPVAVCFVINSPMPDRRSTVFGNGLPLGIDTTITFGTWVASPGSYVAACSVYLPTEQVLANNKREQPFVVKQGGGLADWLRKADLPRNLCAERKRDLRILFLQHGHQYLDNAEINSGNR